MTRRFGAQCIPTLRVSRDVPLSIAHIPGAWSLRSIMWCGDQEFARLVPFKRRADPGLTEVVVKVTDVSMLRAAGGATQE